MADPLVQNQEPLTQAADQQPVFQRSIDPNKLKAFLIQKNYKDKITTILGDDNPETAEIFNMEGLSWKEKYAEAKTRTSPIVDKIDQLVMNDATTADDMIRFYTENPNLTKGEASLFRSSLSTVRSRAATKATTERSADIAYSKDQKAYDKHQNTIDLHSTNALNIATDIDLGIQQLTGNYIDTGTDERNLSDDPDYKVMMENIDKFLGHDHIDADGKVIQEGKYGSGDYAKTRQSAWALSQKINFPKGTGFVNEQGEFIEWAFDVKNPIVAQTKWTNYIMKKVDKLQESAMKVTDFMPTQPEFKQDLQQHKQQLEQNVEPNEQVGTDKPKFNWAKPVTP